MYKDVVKRVLAWVLVCCMIGSTPDFSLWAASTGGGEHSYQLEDGNFTEVIDTGAQTATITNTFVMDGNDVSGMHVQEVGLISFGVNNGEGGDHIHEADYTLTVSSGGKTATASGQYQQSPSGWAEIPGTNLTGDTIQAGAGDEISVALTLKNAVWRDKNGGQISGKDNICFLAAQRNGEQGSSSSNAGNLGGKAACIRIKTQEAASQELPTGISFAGDSPEAIKVGEQAGLQLVFTPSTAGQREVEWTSSDTSVASVNQNGQVSGAGVGRVTITATLKADSNISASHTLRVCKDMDSRDITVSSIANQPYTGLPARPKVEVSDGSTKLVEGTHFNSDYDNNTNAGTAKVVLTGVLANGYLGTKEVGFTIDPASLNGVKVEGLANVSYTLPTQDEIDAFQASSGNASATGEDVLQAKILDDLKKKTIKIIYAPYTSQINELVPEKDYTITGRKLNVAGASAYIEITGQGNYKDVKRISIPIKKSINDPDIKVTDASSLYNFHYRYTGKVIEPKIVVKDGTTTLVKDRDYTVEGYYNDAAGTVAATADAGDKYVIITGKGAYASDDGSGNPVKIAQKYDVSPVNVADSDVKITVPKQVAGFDASNIKMEVTFDGKVLTKGTDYTVTIKPTSGLGVWDVIVQGQGNFIGTETVPAKAGIDIASMNIRFADSDVGTKGTPYLGGNEVKPGIVITDTAGTEVPKSEYILEYSNNKNAGTAKIKITGADEGLYGGMAELTFQINPVNVDSLTYDYEQSVLFNVKMTNGALDTSIKPSITGKYSGNSESGRFNYTLVKEKDYTVTYSNEDQAGTATITVTGAGNFTGTTDLEYIIEERDLSQPQQETGNVLEFGCETPVYAGKPLTVADLGAYVKHNDIVFSEASGTDSALQQFCQDNFEITMQEVGNNQVMVFWDAKAGGNYTGSYYTTIEVMPCDISGSNVVIEPVGEVEYRKDAAATPEPVVKLASDPSIVLTKDTDYTLSYQDNEEAGKATVVITGKGNYTGSNKAEFVIYKDLDSTKDYADTIELANPIPQQYYTGSAIELKPEDVSLQDVLKGGGNKAIDSSAYTLGNYKNNTAVGDATVTVTGTTNGYYRGSRELTFTIATNSIANVDVTLDNTEFDFTGEKIEPSVTVSYNGATLTKDVDYTVRYQNNINAGSKETSGEAKAPQVMIFAKPGGNFAGVGGASGNMKTVYFTIYPKQLNRTNYEYTYPKDPDAIQGNNGSYDYSSVSLKDTDRNKQLSKGTDYMVDCKFVSAGAGPDDPDNGKLTFIGRGNYEGEIPFDVLLEKQEIVQSDVTVTFSSGQTFVYTGKSVLEDPAFDLVVRKTDTGKLLVRGVDYRVIAADGYTNDQFTNCTGETVKFQIQFISNEFSGTLAEDRFNFSIAKKNIADSDVSVSIPNQAAGDGALEPKVTITYNGMTLTGGTDYTYEVFDNKPADIAAGKKPYVVITASAGDNKNYRGTRTEYFGIGKSIAAAEVTLSTSGYAVDSNGYYIYQADPITPDAVVKLEGKTLRPNVDYTLSYENNVDISDFSDPQNHKNAKAIVTGAGEYGGQKIVDFVITNKDAANSLGGSVVIPRSVTAEFTGSQVEPDLKIVYNRPGKQPYTLIPGKDYIMELSGDLIGVGDNKDATVDFRGNFMYSVPGEKPKISVTIVAKSFKDADDETDPGDIYFAWNGQQTEYNYEGQPITPGYTLVDLKRNLDGSYKKDGGSQNISSCYKLKSPKDVQAGEAADYTLEWRNNDRPGEAQLVLTGNKNYKSTERIIKTFKIKGTLNWATIEFAKPDFPNDNNRLDCFQYTGKRIQPELKIYFGNHANEPLLAGKGPNDIKADYWCEYPEDCINVGEGKTIIIHGMNAYADSGDFEIDYKIVPRDINDATVENLGSFAYTGENVKPVPKLYYGGVLLRPDLDYICTWEENCSAINDETKPYYEVSVTANPDGNFTGRYQKKEITYKVGNSFSEANGISVELRKDSYKYTGDTIIPQIVVRDQKYTQPLEEGVDYKVAIDEDNPEYINAGKKTFRIYGLETNHPYVGDITKEFTIIPIDLSAANATEIVMDEEGILKDTAQYKYQYFGREHRPEPSVNWMRDKDGIISKILLSQEDGDFTYTYQNNINAGTATITVGPGDVKSGGSEPNFTGSRDLNFTINPIHIDEDSSLLKVLDERNWIYTYTGKEVIPQVSIEYNGTVLTSGVDYEVTSGFTNITEDAKALIRFKGNYEGSVTRPFVIRRRSILSSGVDIALEGGNQYKYTGQSILPKVTITCDGTTLAAGTDYTINYGENHDVGLGTIDIQGINNFEQGTELTFDILPIDITSADVEVQVDSGVVTVAKPNAEPEFTVYWIKEDGTKTRVYAEGEGDPEGSVREIAYTYRYYNNTVIGEKGHLALTGKNNFTGVRDVEFDIGADINDYVHSVEWKDGEPSLEFNNAAQKPKVAVTLNESGIHYGLTEGNDYEVVYEPVSDNGDGECINAGDYKAYVKGIGKYAGRMGDLRYTIRQRDLSKVNFTIPDKAFTGSALKPDITARDEEIDLDLELVVPVGNQPVGKPNGYLATIPENLVNAGKVSIEIWAVEAGNYTGRLKKDFVITPKDVTDVTVKFDPSVIEEQKFTGTAIRPTFTITDTARNNAGFAVAAGTGDYVLKPEDCTITYTDNIYPGTAKITVEGRNNYGGKLIREFTISADLSMAEIAPIPAQPYTGQPVTPPLTVTLGGHKLVEGVDFIVNYQNNVDRGIATVTITAAPLSKYTGEKTATFEIGRDLANAQVRAIADAFTYTGNPIVPQIAVVYGNDILREGVDYTVVFSNNVNVGAATVTVTAMGAYTGRIERTFDIVAKNVTRCSFSEVETKLYNNQATSQNLVLTDGGRTLVENQDYAIAYVNNTNPGTATIQVSGLGNYGGVKTIRYNIEVKPMTNTKASATSNSVKLSWSAVDSAQGYAVYNDKNRLVGTTSSTSFTHKKLSSMKSYSYRVRPYVVSDGATYFGDFANTVKVTTTPPTPSKVKVKAGSRQAKISWAKIKGVTGYEVYRSTKKSRGYKKVTTIKKANTTSYTNKKLSKNKKYYFKVRAYKTVNGKKLYSSYSSPKQVKVK